MRRFLLLAIAIPSCGPAEQPSRDVYQVSAPALVAYYRDNPRGTAYHGHRIQVRLEPTTYAVDGREVHYYTGLPRTPPVIVFRCVDQPQASPERHWVIVTGLCAGPTWDGVRKSDRVDFTIYVDDCQVTVVSTR